MKHALIVAAFAAALFAAPALAQSNPEGTRLVTEARQAFDVGDFDRAAQLLWDATMADTAVRDSAPLQTLRGRAVMRTGRPENAVRIFDKIGGTSAEYADALYWRGEALMMMTEPGEAADTFRHALEFDPNHRQAQMRLSSLPAGISTPVAVEAPLVEAAPVERITRAPVGAAQDAPAAVAPAAPAAPVPNAAPAPETDGPASLRPPAVSPPLPPPAMPPAAAEAEDRAEAAPTSNLALGRAAFEAGDYAEAAALLWRATEADESVRADADVQILRARAVMLSGRPEAAIAVFARVAEEGTAGSTLAEALYWRGEAEMMLGREDAAQDSFRLALDAQPGHALAEERLIGLAPAARPRAMAQASPEPGLIRVAATAPRSRPQPAPESESEPAPAEDAETTPPSDAELDAAAEDFRQQAEEARETGDDAAEARALSELYLTQRATDEEIEGYTELVRQTGSDDIGRDAQIAQLAGIAHHDLAVALYDAVEAAGTESGRVEGRNLAVLRTNWATALLDSGDAEAALETANAAVDADDTYGNAFGVRSLAQRELGDLGRALEDAKKAYDLGATAPRVLALLNAAGFAVGPDQAQLQTEAEASEAALRGSSD